jgi:hypothetical protein
MSKKKKSYKLLLQKVFIYVEICLFNNLKYFEKNKEYFYQNIFRISTSFRQLFFSLLNLNFNFVKLISAGVILKNYVTSFKFFKKSIFNINPLVIVMRHLFVDFFKRVYFLESLNYSKKQFLFLKKLLNSVQMDVKYMLFKKTWQYSTKPVKRIKRRIVKMLHKL